MTELDDNNAALVANTETQNFEIYLPHDTEDETGMFAFLCACAVRANEDPDWAQAMIDWYYMHGQQLN